VPIAPILVVQHVSWETPHRILLAFEGMPIIHRCVLEGDPLPDPRDITAAVFMGGPMSVNDIADFPGLRTEREWLQMAIALDLPILGVCLGAQLIAAALGSTVGPGDQKELGVQPIHIHDPEDALLAALAPSCEVLHWHGEVFDLPVNATLLASSELTPVQGFRCRNAWGLLFHAEADAELVDLWLAEPTMAAEAHDLLGPGANLLLRTDAARLTPTRGDLMFQSFAARAAATTRI